MTRETVTHVSIPGLEKKRHENEWNEYHLRHLVYLPVFKSARLTSEQVSPTAKID